MAAVELVLDCRNMLGEGAVWNVADGRLWWTDIEGSRLWTHEPESGRCASHRTPERVSCFAPRRNGKGLVVAFSSGFALYDPVAGLRQDTGPDQGPPSRAKTIRWNRPATTRIAPSR